MATTTTRLGLKVIDTPAVDTVAELRQSINNHATILDAQYIESTFGTRPAAASKGRVHRSTDTGEIAIDTGSAWEPLWGPASISRSVLDVGLVGQSRAGRQLAASDFTDCGALAPIGLWNLGSVSDVSGNGLNLTNKGSVPFGIGIEGAAASAAVFAGSASQGLYRVDGGGGDPLRIRTGSWGCWFKTAKRGTVQSLIGRYGAAGQRAFQMEIASSNNIFSSVYLDGTTSVGPTTATITDVCDDRWHLAVAVYNGSVLRLYIDGVLEATGPVTAAGGGLFQGASELCIGARGLDNTGTSLDIPNYGRIDEAFVTGEVLTADQIRHLYGCKFAHGGASPRRSSLRVTRRRLGAALANGDFPATPLRVYNFAAGALTDLNGGAAVAAVGGGAIVAAAGPDGQKDSAVMFSGAHTGLGSSDTGLPATTASRSYGAWFNTAQQGVAAQTILCWGTVSSAHAVVWIDINGMINCNSGADSIVGPFVADGRPHHVLAVEENAPADGVKRKLYLDGVLVGTSTTLTSLTLVGANGLRIGADAGAGGNPFRGTISRAVVYAGALTWEQVQAVYMKASALLQASPKDAAHKVERLGGSNVVFIGDDFDPQHLIDLEVSR